MVQPAKKPDGRHLDDDSKQELDSIASKNGVVTPLAIVAFAKNPKSALHSHFTWDETEAAHRWRIEQAKCLIRCYVTILPGRTEPVRALVSLSTDRDYRPKSPGMGEYRPVGEVMKMKATRDTLIDDAKRDLRSFVRKFEVLKSMTTAQTQTLFKAIEDFLKAIEK